MVVTFLVVTLGITFLLSLVPGDPARYIAGEGAPEEVVDALNARYHFDDPVLLQYLRWLGNLVQGDLGVSHQTQRPVLDMIVERLPVTIELAVLATLLALLLAVPAALLVARRPGSRLDQAIGAGATSMISVPGFALAMILTYIFAYRLAIFPVIGWVPLTDNVSQNLRSAVLPVTSIALAQAVILFRVLRADLIEVSQQEYIAVARSKGFSRRAVTWRHALKPSSFSLLTLAGLTFAQLLGGAVVVESIFLLPGLGLLVIQAVNRNDLLVVQGVVVFVAAGFLIINLLIDSLYGLLDPRTRADER